jgi:hypothetical protein
VYWPHPVHDAVGYEDSSSNDAYHYQKEDSVIEHCFWWDCGNGAEAVWVKRNEVWDLAEVYMGSRGLNLADVS